MILVFDLDDTLYAERSYVESGFRSVASWLDQRFGWDQETSYQFMMDVLEKEGRGRIFDRLLTDRGISSGRAVRECLGVYRHHLPNIQLCPAASELLTDLAGQHALYLVTDGHKIAQARKVEALGLQKRFRRVYITHRYGLQFAKPSTACFERIQMREGRPWNDMVHIADNPVKDFVNLTPLGVRTIRVLTGAHRQVEAAPGYDARYRIPDLTHLPELLHRIEP
jgi:putative hydrolase of the HAD superfamily